MKLLRYDDAGGHGRLGVLRDGTVIAIDHLVEACPMPPERLTLLAARGIAPAVRGMLRWLQLGTPARATLASVVARTRASQWASLPLASVRLRAPVARPGKIVGVGRNYADHAKETGVAPFEQPRIIFKVSSSIADPGATVIRPDGVHKMDFEAELGVVIGEFAHLVTAESALDFVAGYTALNDLSAREFQFDIAPAQTTFAKSMDGFCPLGPWLVTADEIADPQALRVQSWVNGVQMQDASTADMLFPVRALIAYVSQFMTLEPGDVIATGTPAGIGAFRTPPQWLAPGDRVRVEVSGIGVLESLIA